VARHKIVHQDGDVFAPFSQRRNLDREDIDPVKQIFAKLILTNHRLQVAVRCGNQSHIHANALVASQPLELLLLDSAQQLRLQVHGDVAHFVKKKCSAIGHLESPIDIGRDLFEITDAVDLNASMDAAVHSSPLLQALRDKVAAYHHGVRVQEADYLPQITAISGKELVTSKLAQTDPTWFAGAHASLQLWDGGERRARVSEARSQLRSAEFEYHHAEEQVRLAVRNAYLDLQSERSELVSAQKAAERNAEALRLANKRFDVGTGTSLEVLDANVSLTASQIGIQQALWGMDLAYLRIHRYLGDIAEVSTRIQK
jgi:hypothetical protein